MSSQPILPRIACWSVVALLAAAPAVSAQCLESLGMTTGSHSAPEDGFGASISVEGIWMAVGAPRTNGPQNQTGLVYMFHRDGQHWVEQSVLANHPARESDRFGASVSVSGDRVLVGIPGADLGATDAGAAVIYHWDGSDWVLEAVLSRAFPQASDGLGLNVLLDGDDAFVGYPGVDLNDHGEGEVRAYHFDGIQWSFDRTIILPDPQPADSFGATMAKAGDRLLISAIGADGLQPNAGIAFVYLFSDGQWNQEAALSASDGLAGDLFGFSLDMTSDWVVVGAPRRDSGRGTAYIYKRDGSDWIQHTELPSPDPALNNAFSTGLAIDGDLIVIGQPGTALAPGHARAFRFRLVGDEWTYEDRMRDIDTWFGYEYGSVIALTPDTLAVSASYEPEFQELPTVCLYDRNGRCGAELSAETGCPAPNFALTVRWNGATPNGRVALIQSPRRGFVYIPSAYSCSGTWLGLGAIGVRTVYQGTSGPNGGRVLDSHGTRALCGTYLQLLDLQSCVPSNVIRLDHTTNW